MIKAHSSARTVCSCISDVVIALIHCEKTHLKKLMMKMVIIIREYGSTLYVGLPRAVSPTNTNFRLTFLLTRLQEALYEDLAL